MDSLSTVLGRERECALQMVTQHVTRPEETSGLIDETLKKLTFVRKQTQPQIHENAHTHKIPSIKDRLDQISTQVKILVIFLPKPWVLVP